MLPISQEIVDIFAPGMEIYSTIPEGEYKKQQGTSFAAPVVSGIAAVVRSYFPDLSAKQVKEILKKYNYEIVGKKEQEKLEELGSWEKVQHHLFSYL